MDEKHYGFRGPKIVDGRDLNGDYKVSLERPKQKCVHGVWHANSEGLSPICSVCQNQIAQTAEEITQEN